MNPDKLEAQARTVADRATCRTVNSAIVAYVGVNDRDPESIADVVSYVDGDISAYTIVNGMASGPGCADRK